MPYLNIYLHRFHVTNWLYRGLLLRCSASLCSAMPCSAALSRPVWYYAMQCYAVQRTAVERTALCRAVQRYTVQYSTIPCSAMLCSALPCSTLTCSELPYSALQYVDLPRITFSWAQYTAMLYRVHHTSLQRIVCITIVHWTIYLKSKPGSWTDIIIRNLCRKTRVK